MIGIVILNYKTYEKTFKCIDSIKKNTKQKYKIYVVDNASPNSSYLKLKKRYQDDKLVEIIQNDKNSGYSAGNNLGVLKAIKDGAKQVAIVNNDVYFVNDALDVMLKTLLEKRVAVAGPSVLTIEGKESQLIRPVWKYKDYLKNKKPFCYFLRKSADTLTTDTSLVFRGMVSGCCFLIDSETFKELDFFDENVFLYGEELILAYKLDRLNYDCVFEPKAIIVHEGGGTISKEAEAFERFYRYLSGLYYLKFYYKANKIQMIFAISINYLPYLANSFVKKSYRKKIGEFRKKAFSYL